MNGDERAKMVKCMEFIARQLNDEEIFYNWWLSEGVADGDIEYGDLSLTGTEEEMDYLNWYMEDNHFAYLMKVFLICMSKAYKSGGLYCDGIVSGGNYGKSNV